MPSIKEPVFKDIPLAFTAHPVTKNLKVLTNADAIKQSVKNIVRTNFFERRYSPYFGGNVTAQLFENSGSITEFEIRANIIQALKNYEPRADVRSVKVVSAPDSNELAVTVTFSIRNDPNPYAVDIFLERVR